MEPSNVLRNLDIDDLWVLYRLGTNCRLGVIAKELCVTPPAVTHRMKKYLDVFGVIFEDKTTDQRTVLTSNGMRVSRKCGKALNVLMGNELLAPEVLTAEDIQKKMELERLRADYAKL